MVKHSARGYAVDACTLDAETDDAAGEYVHHRYDPERAQQDGFAAKHVDGPQAILGLRDGCQPRGSIGAGVVWPGVLGEHAARDIFVYVVLPPIRI